jgi:predicted DNA-binding protein YlxM (UPF0122 family)
VEVEKKLEISLLNEFYGKLLTDKQYEFIKLYYDGDVGLTEIAASYNISRQAVRDAILRGEKTLFLMEEKLSLFSKYNGIKDSLAVCDSLLRQGRQAECIELINKISDEI